LVQAEGKVEALCIIVAISFFDGGRSISATGLGLACVILGDPQGFEFLREKKITKPSGEGGEAVVDACHGGHFASNFFNSTAGIVAAV
jgi:hypothetical protein